MCLCADLVVATHGRGYWILDDITPLRQSRRGPVRGFSLPLQTGHGRRVRFATNDPRHGRPELPAGARIRPSAELSTTTSPPAAPGPVRVDILRRHGKAIGHPVYSTARPTVPPDPARDPDAYTALCQTEAHTSAFEPCAVLAERRNGAVCPAGHATASPWDLHYQPTPPRKNQRRGESGRRGAQCHHRTEPTVDAPWAPAGSYTVRLTVAGKRYEQPVDAAPRPACKDVRRGSDTFWQCCRDRCTTSRNAGAARNTASSR